MLIPQRPDPSEVWCTQWQPLRYGAVETGLENLTNTSFRVTSTVRELKAGGAMEEKFEVFAGPKRPDLLEQYRLGDIITYGWFGPVAKLLLGILHTFYSLIPNYGVAIILLTVLVRSCMFPLSKKQALNAQKMQELQPEIKKIQEKYKNNLEARGKAQQELFRKHNYNPMGGCLILFLQLPIFVGLYRALMVDVELYQAPLLTESIRWASNLAAPDMLFDWHNFMPAFVSRGVGMFGLGPYFNLLPILTIVLFIWQQKKFMPPPTDEQQAMQQKIMQYMMIFMGILFFKVASGLCIYFIASSLWSIAERQFLPKTAAAGGGPAASTASPRPSPARDGSPAAKRKTRGRRN
jgi:YidC/Oxa1 family membrane protein insertase